MAHRQLRHAAEYRKRRPPQYDYESLMAEETDDFKIGRLMEPIETIRLVRSPRLDMSAEYMTSSEIRKVSPHTIEETLQSAATISSRRPQANLDADVKSNRPGVHEVQDYQIRKGSLDYFDTIQYSMFSVARGSGITVERYRSRHIMAQQDPDVTIRNPSGNQDADIRLRQVRPSLDPRDVPSRTVRADYSFEDVRHRKPQLFNPGDVQFHKPRSDSSASVEFKRPSIMEAGTVDLRKPQSNIDAQLQTRGPGNPLQPEFQGPYLDTASIQYGNVESRDYATRFTLEF